MLVLVGATELKPPGGEVATKGLRASWGSINVKLFIPLGGISRVPLLVGVTGK
jgi:hypothetical protein